MDVGKFMKERTEKLDAFITRQLIARSVSVCTGEGENRSNEGSKFQPSPAENTSGSQGHHPIREARVAAVNDLVAVP